MNKTFFFFCLSTLILVLSFVAICISPIINNIEVDVPTLGFAGITSTSKWSFSSWRTLNCKIFADKENSDSIALDEIQKMKKMKNLCYRKNAMHDLEFASLIINVVLGFICANLSLLHYLNVGKDFEKKTGIIGLITGIVGFVITLVYVCYNSYIFDNDIAYGTINLSYFENPTSNPLFTGGIKKLYPNGATHKNEFGQFKTPYENDKEDYSEFIKYKDLGEKQYNYDSKLYQTYTSQTITDNCKVDLSVTGATIPNSCSYGYTQYPFTSLENKYLYDRWLTTLILGFIIVVCNIGLLIFGILLCKSGNGESNEPQPVAIV